MVAAAMGPGIARSQRIKNNGLNKKIDNSFLCDVGVSILRHFLAFLWISMHMSTPTSHKIELSFFLFRPLFFIRWERAIPGPIAAASMEITMR